MISRYTLPEMGKIWKEEEKLATWLKIEILVCEAWVKLGKIPESALQEIKKRAKFNIKRIKEIEKDVKHDLIAFLTNVAEYTGPYSRYIHLGLTSSDILDTGLAIQMVSATRIIIKNLKELMEVLKEKAKEHKDTLMMGRTHGVHAE
ncbi:MAG: lyase family protein, partial [Candidatus Aerophobetes bacterium]|nr:lyase family protein [Candidatus Aerophobetes bacterium]